jgi:hypothetical protein
VKPITRMRGMRRPFGEYPSIRGRRHSSSISAVGNLRSVFISRLNSFRERWQIHYLSWFKEMSLKCPSILVQDGGLWFKACFLQDDQNYARVSRCQCWSLKDVAGNSGPENCPVSSVWGVVRFSAAKPQSAEM